MIRAKCGHCGTNWKRSGHFVFAYSWAHLTAHGCTTSLLEFPSLRCQCRGDGGCSGGVVCLRAKANETEKATLMILFACFLVIEVAAFKNLLGRETSFRYGLGGDYSPQVG